jgi:putative ABC transport system permease protein
MLRQDLLYAWRTLARRPVFTLIAVATLALGLGANTAMFTVVRAVLLRPLPYPDPDALVKIVGLDRPTGDLVNLSPADFLDFAAESRTLQRTGAHGSLSSFTVADRSGSPERVGGVLVTEGFFPTLGARFALGRPFTAEDDAPNRPPVVVLGHGYWQRRYGGDPRVLGQRIDVNARPATIIGVLAAEFRHIETSPEREADLFLPYQFETVNANRGGHFIRAVGRLHTGATVEQANAVLVATATRLEREQPDENTPRGEAVRGLHAAIVAETRPAVLLLSAAVGFVLLVACANLANLLLAHGASRRTELAVRAALGAGRRPLMRLLLMESLLLSTLGAAVGVIVAFASSRALTTLAAAGIPRAGDITVDGSVLAFAAIVSVATGLIAGVLPAWQMSGGDLQAAVREGSRGQVRPALHRPVRGLLVAAPLALALMLLTGAGLMMRSLWQLLHVDTGFSTERVVTFDIAVPTATYAEGDQIPFYERFYDAIRAQPGVAEVGAINIMPLSANYDSRGVQIEAHPQPVGQAASIQARSISPDYFRVMGIPLIGGRVFSNRDREGQTLVVIVSESMAKRYWPGEDPIGQHVTFNSGVPRDQQREIGGPGSREVIGIVGDVKHLGLAEGEVPMFYTPQAQQPSYHTMSLVVRASTDPTTLTNAIRAELARLDRGVPLYRVRTLDAVVRSTAAAPEMRAWLFALFAILALILSVIGVYGVVGYLVGQRTQEIGIRLALGAERGRVLRALLAEGLRPVAFGLVAGVLVSLAMGRLLTRLLFGVTATDPTTYSAVVLVLLAAAVVATWIPARRALRVDPMRALRSE